MSAVESLAGTEVQRVEVDLSRVTFMDSSGVSALCLAKAKLEVDGTVLVLRELSTPVDAVLRMCGLENEFVRDPGRFLTGCPRSNLDRFGAEGGGYIGAMPKNDDRTKKG